jgi:hypothetical protein
MFFSQNLCSSFIISDLVVFIVLTSIQFNAKLCFMRVKIKDEACFRILATKLDIVKTAVAKDLPQELFAFRGVFTKFTDARFEFFWKARIILMWLALIPGPSPEGGDGSTPPPRGVGSGVW